MRTAIASQQVSFEILLRAPMTVAATAIAA
jgi:hypothetical protein